MEAGRSCSRVLGKFRYSEEVLGFGQMIWVIYTEVGKAKEGPSFVCCGRVGVIS